MGSILKLVETSSEQIGVEVPTEPTNVLRSLSVLMSRSLMNDDPLPFIQPVHKIPKKPDTAQISPLYQASARFAQVMIQRDSRSLHEEDLGLERQQQVDIEMAEVQAPYSRPFLQAEEAVNDTGILKQVIWGAARGLRLPDTGNHGISRHLIIPSVSPMLPTCFRRSFN